MEGVPTRVKSRSSADDGAVISDAITFDTAEVEVWDVAGYDFISYRHGDFHHEPGAEGKSNLPVFPLRYLLPPLTRVSSISGFSLSEGGPVLLRV